jgi:hypothetical protein
MKTGYIIHLVLVSSIVSATKTSTSQPFIDLLNIHYITSPGYGFINQENNETSLRNFAVQATLPFQFNNKRDAIIFSPSFEMWSPEVHAVHRDFKNQYGLALPVSFLKTLNNPGWSIISTIIARRNGYDLALKDNWQLGGALLVNFKANENLRYKIGLYANKEFFGIFVVPLLGIDWEMSKRTNLFGTLPGSLTLEHKLRKSLYTGASFRAITNSYRNKTGYWRLDENRLGIFLDYYLSKTFVLNAEAGHTIFRKIRAGLKDKWQTDWNANDNAYVKVSMAYRVRFR